MKNTMKKLLLLKTTLIACGASLLSLTALAKERAFDEYGFRAWQRNFADYLNASYQKLQIKKSVIEEFAKVAPVYRVIKADRNQAEFHKFVGEYIEQAVNERRISRGQQLMREHQAMMHSIASKSQVAPEIIMAIWGMETSYGSFIGSVSALSAMATLAFEGRRRSYFESEIIAFLQLVSRGDMAIDQKGSWAGGLGFTQFMPSSYHHYAQDFDGDGKRDLWSVGDALASSAYYLMKNGWRGGEEVMLEVIVPEGFDYRLSYLKEMQSLDFWAQQGVRTIHGERVQGGSLARLFIPSGADGVKLLLFHNFNVIKRYNPSDSYALAIALLAERIKGRDLVHGFVKPMRRFTKNDIIKVQQLLQYQGFLTTKITGRLDANTRRALADFQHYHQLIADGFLTETLFEFIIQEAGEHRGDDASGT